jgi:UvrD-like helicase C-terminal domain/AAA domain
MFSRIIPSWDQIKNFNQPLQDGEVCLLKFLDAELPRDENFNDADDIALYNGWLIFVQPYLNGSRPDVVIFNPHVGVQIIEVKDWNLHHYSVDENSQTKSENSQIKSENSQTKSENSQTKSENSQTKSENSQTKWEVCVSDNRGKHEVQSPFKQVEHYKKKLIEQLVPQIGEEISGNKKVYGVIRTSIYFNKATTAEAHELFKPLKVNYKYIPVFGYDDLTDDHLTEIIPDHRRTKSYYWNKEWNKEILFWLKPPFHSLEQGIPLTLNKHQKKFAEPLPGHHRVRGVVGSGKTQVLAYRAASLASQGYRVLILSFNITLWHYIKDMVARCPLDFNWSNIEFNHFHGFCRDILNKSKKKWPVGGNDGDTFFRQTVPDEVLEAIAGRNYEKYNYEKYDAVLIDEGQDYYVEWYSMLCHFLTDRDEVVVVCDKKQNIYDRKMEWLDKRRSGVEKFGEWIELKTIVRLPEKIAEMIKEFSETFALNQDVRVDNVERPSLFNQYQEHSAWWNINEEEWLTKVNDGFTLLKRQKTFTHYSDVVILLPDKNYGLPCVKHFENIHIGVNHVFDQDNTQRNKKTFWMGDGRLKISTIHSFKGWEALNVILFIPKNYLATGADNVQHRIVYTAMTRTRQNLIVINASEHYWKFGEKLSKTLFENSEFEQFSE